MECALPEKKGCKVGQKGVGLAKCEMRNKVAKCQIETVWHKEFVPPQTKGRKIYESESLSGGKESLFLGGLIALNKMELKLVIDIAFIQFTRSELVLLRASNLFEGERAL